MTAASLLRVLNFPRERVPVRAKVVEWCLRGLDGFTYWHAGALALELGIPARAVRHAVSELSGISSLARHLARVFPQVWDHHIEQMCVYRRMPEPGSYSERR
jgi:hypothetical protein